MQTKKLILDSDRETTYWTGFRFLQPSSGIFIDKELTLSMNNEKYGHNLKRLHAFRKTQTIKKFRYK
ncbi:CLUMA_CG008942, isoform A [Clunio marinus]|uniref:CLUMA_CG008942, isoform A n=1 Tax=Clunio marinus TaxID=568069 RepID=A0A1J1IAL7_9DIPT|nr:CLUMA_CG008942, isoform A [Clunio marinus]